MAAAAMTDMPYAQTGGIIIFALNSNKELAGKIAR